MYFLEALPCLAMVSASFKHYSVTILIFEFDEVRSAQKIYNYDQSGMVCKDFVLTLSIVHRYDAGENISLRHSGAWLLRGKRHLVIAQVTVALYEKIPCKKTKQHKTHSTAIM